MKKPKIKQKLSKKAFKKQKALNKEMYRFTQRLYYFLRHHQDLISFQKLSQGVYGYYDFGTEEITIDYRREVIPTLIHEILHHWYPSWSETKVINEERRLVNSLTPSLYKNILRVLAQNI